MPRSTIFHQDQETHLMLRTVDPRSQSRTALAAMLVLTGGLALSAAQSREDPPTNPFKPTPAVLQEGMAAFRANCAYCHGMDARGSRGRSAAPSRTSDRATSR